MTDSDVSGLRFRVEPLSVTTNDYRYLVWTELRRGREGPLRVLGEDEARADEKVADEAGQGHGSERAVRGPPTPPAPGFAWILQPLPRL